MVRRIEDVANAGTYDLWVAHFGTCAWVELKVLPHWPKRPDTLVTFPELTQAQIAFGLAAYKAHVQTWWLIRIEASNEVLLLDPARVLLNRSGPLYPGTKAAVTEHAVVYG